MSVGIGKLSNEYARQLYGVEASKTVFMAIAYSLAVQLCDGRMEQARALVLADVRAALIPVVPRERGA